jgi:hypothetical protein
MGGLQFLLMRLCQLVRTTSCGCCVTPMGQCRYSAPVRSIDARADASSVVNSNGMLDGRYNMPALPLLKADKS